MKKFISGVILALVMAGSAALAKTVPVVALTPFASNSPTETMVVKVKSNIQVTDDVVLFENFTVKGKVVPTNNGAFAFVPFSYINVHNEELPVKAQTYGVFAGFVVNGQTTPVASPFNINAGQMFILNFKDVQEEIVRNVEPREGAKEIITKLKDEGNTILIITARDSKLHDDPYKLSKTWLDKNNIPYDRIIVNAQEKDIICKKEKVDIFIDDQLANCTKVSKTGIQVIRITNYEEVHGNIINKKNWMEIYDYIKEFETKK